MERFKAAWNILTGKTPLPQESQSPVPIQKMPERKIIKPPSPPKKPAMTEDEEERMEEYRGKPSATSKKEGGAVPQHRILGMEDILSERPHRLGENAPVGMGEKLLTEERMERERSADKKEEEASRFRNKVRDEEIDRQLGKKLLYRGLSISETQRKLLEEEDVQIRTKRFPIYTREEEEQIAEARRQTGLSSPRPSNERRRLNFPTPEETKAQKQPKSPETVNQKETIEYSMHEATKRLIDFRTEFISAEILSQGTGIRSEIIKLKEYEVERTRIKNGIFVRSHKEDMTEGIASCQDAGAVAYDRKGNIKSFAIADGVTGSSGGGEAAHEAVVDAISFLEERKKGQDFKKICEEIAEETEKRMRTVFKKILQPVWKKYHEENKAQNPMLAYKRKAERASGSTTLLSGFIEGNTLYISRLGDGGFMVIGKDGKIKISSNAPETARNVPHIISLGLRDTASPVSESYAISLSGGDLFIGNSDGLFKSLTQREEFTEAQRASQVSQMRKQGNTVEEIVFALLNDALGGDDNSILAFEYVAEKE